jgi:hypothetical protein
MLFLFQLAILRVSMVENKIQNVQQKCQKTYCIICSITSLANACNKDMSFTRKTASVSLPLIFRQTSLIKKHIGRQGKKLSQ